MIVQNAKQGYVVARFNATGSMLIETANSTNSANCMVVFDPVSNTSAETINSVNIVNLAWTVPAAQTWTITRGANTIIVLGGNGQLDLQTDGLIIDSVGDEPQANIVCTLSGGTGTLIVKAHKRSTLIS